MNNEEIDHFYSYYSSPIHDLFKEFQELTRSANLRLFHDTNKDSSDLFLWLSNIIYFKGEDDSGSKEEELIEDI